MGNKSHNQTVCRATAALLDLKKYISGVEEGVLNLKFPFRQQQPNLCVFLISSSFVSLSTVSTRAM